MRGKFAHNNSLTTAEQSSVPRPLRFTVLIMRVDPAPGPRRRLAPALRQAFISNWITPELPWRGPHDRAPHRWTSGFMAPLFFDSAYTSPLRTAPHCPSCPSWFSCELFLSFLPLSRLCRALLTRGHSKSFTILSNIHPSMHTFTQR